MRARLLFLAFAALASSLAAADGITSQQADAILQELRNIRALLERGQPAPAQAPQPVPQPPVKVSLKGAPVLGKRDATPPAAAARPIRTCSAWRPASCAT